MTRVERLLCRAGLHQWEKWLVTETPLIPILSMDEMAKDGLIFDSQDLAISTHTRTCKRCGQGQVKNILHW